MTSSVLDLISKTYRDEQRLLHAAPRGYGAKGGKWAETVVQLAGQVDAWSILDYGCGQGGLAERVKAIEGRMMRVAEYDPAIDGKDALPAFADLVACTDVLEHVELERLPLVLAHIRSLARKAVFLVVALDPANKTLSDGRNAHLIQESPEWWAQTVTAAGFKVSADVDSLTLPVHYTPEKRSKRWIAVAVPS